jgi:plastocyanin
MKMIFVVILAAAAIACGYKSPMSPSPGTVGARIESSGFAPNPVTVPAGGTITWTNGDSVAHTVVGENPAFDSGAIAPGGTFSQMFPTAGMFTYHDGANPSMAGVVTVSTPTNSPSY